MEEVFKDLQISVNEKRAFELASFVVGFCVSINGLDRRTDGQTDRQIRCFIKQYYVL